MSIRNRTELKAQAREALAAAESPKKLFFLYISVSVGISLLCALLNFLLNMGMTAFTGLEGITARSLLQTLQSLLETASSLALPFWQFGLIFLTLQLVRGRAVAPGTLLEGFRQLGPAVRLYLLKTLIMIGAAIGSIYAVSLLLVLTPLANLMLANMGSLPEAETEEEIMQLMQDPAVMKQMFSAMLPLMLVMLAAMLAVLIPIFYRLRMTDYVLMDHPEAGARNAIRTSWHMMKGNCMSLFMLDLSFWWFALLELLLSAVYMLGTFLPLPIHSAVYFFLCIVLYSIGIVALHTWAGPQVQTTYAAAYEALQAKYYRPAPIEIPTWEDLQN